MLSARPLLGARSWGTGGRIMGVRRRTAVLVATTLAAAGAAQVGSAGLVVAGEPDLVVNGSFEAPEIPPGSFRILPSIPGWTHEALPGATSAGIEIQHNVSGAPAPGAGNQFAELDSDGPGRIFQDVPTQAGLHYRLTFIASPRPHAAADDNRFSASAGTASVTLEPGPGGLATQWSATTLDFVAAGPATRIEFVDLGPEQPAGSGVGAYLDLVEVRLADDADGDGFANDVERAEGSDPFDPASVPPVTASEAVVSTLRATPTPRSPAANALQRAIAELKGQKGGQSSSGAIEKLRNGDRMAALEKLSKTPPHLDEAEQEDPALDLGPPKTTVSLVSRTVAKNDVDRARTMAPDSPAVATATSLLARGDQAHLARNFGEATTQYKKAAGKVQPILGG